MTVVVGVLLVGAAYWGLASLAARYFGPPMPRNSVFNSTPEGLSVWFDYLRGLGRDPKVLRTFSVLPPGSTIIVAGPFDRLPTRAESVRLARWVRDGGRVVAVGSQAGTLLTGLGLRATPATGKASRVEPSIPSAYADGVSSVSPGADRLLSSQAAWVSQLHDSAGHVLLSAAVGDGEVLWLAGAYPVSNSGIGVADNARLAVLLSAVLPGDIYFDEYHHGFADDLTVWDRLGSGGRYAVIMIALGFVAIVLARGRRLGPPLGVLEPPAARTAAYIDSLAELYRKAGARGEALEALEDGLAHAIVRRHGSIRDGHGTAGPRRARRSSVRGPCGPRHP